MKKQNILFLLIITAVLLFVAVACEDKADESSYVDGTSKTTGSVRVISYDAPTEYKDMDGNSREEAPGFEHIKLIAEKGDETEEFLGGKTCPITIPDLETGVWEIHMQLIDKNGDILAVTDSESVTVKEGKRRSIKLGTPKYYNLNFGVTDGAVHVRPESKSVLSGELEIPGSINNGQDKITSIAYQGFTDCPNITKLTFADSITSIGTGAFKKCTGLKEVVISDKITAIGSDAFRECKSLETVTFSEGSKVSIINSYTFYNCVKLNSINIPDTVKNISNNAFQLCGQLKLSKLPDSLQRLGDSAFASCTAIANGMTDSEIVIPSSTTHIGNSAFSGCSSIKKIKLHNGIISIGSGAFVWTQISTVTLPDKLTTISGALFSNCSYLTGEIVIPESVTSIQWSAFANTAITSVKFNSNKNITSLGSSAFNNTKLTSITLPDSITSIGDWCFSGCSELAEIKLSSKLEKIGINAFNGTMKISSITIPATVTELEYQAFKWWTSEQTINFAISEATASGRNFDNLWKDGCNATINWGTK